MERGNLAVANNGMAASSSLDDDDQEASQGHPEVDERSRKRGRPEGLDIADGARTQRVQEKNRQAQARFRQRQKVRLPCICCKGSGLLRFRHVCANGTQEREVAERIERVR